jgi:hypothetical protein
MKPPTNFKDKINCKKFTAPSIDTFTAECGSHNPNDCSLVWIYPHDLSKLNGCNLRFKFIWNSNKFYVRKCVDNAGPIGMDVMSGVIIYDDFVSLGSFIRFLDNTILEIVKYHL